MWDFASKCYGLFSNSAFLCTRDVFRTLSKSITALFAKIVKEWNCIKSVRIRIYSGSHLLTFGLNTERYSVYLRIQFECGKMRSRITPNMDAFHEVWKLLTNFYKKLLHICLTGFYIFHRGESNLNCIEFYITSYR